MPIISSSFPHGAILPAVSESMTDAMSAFRSEADLKREILTVLGSQPGGLY